MKSFSESYKAAGVDVTAGYKAVELMKKHVARTTTEGVVSGIGGFGGLFKPDIAGMEEPILVSGTDGVGTKLKLAFLLNKHDTIGIDAVAMCVNDVVCCGAKPLFFLDYVAVGKNVPERVAEIVSGIADGCVQSGCALVGGETAEMPGFYPVDEYDVAGFCVGMVDKKKIIDLKEDTFKVLSVMAARQGTNLKKLIENLLDKKAEEYDDSEAYRYMSENYPDGQVKLEKNERKEFMDWLGVVEK